MTDDKTLSEQLRDRMDAPPTDRYTLRWWKEQFDSAKQEMRGAAISANKSAAEARDCWAELKKQRERNGELAKLLAAAEARIGKLSEQMTEINERLERHAEFLNQIKAGDVAVKK